MRPEEARRRKVQGVVARVERARPAVPDLGALAKAQTILVGETADAAQAQAEFLAGMRCGGCRRRFTRGWEFVRIVVFDGPGGKPDVRSQPTYACTQDDCDYALLAAETATAMRPVEWAFLDEVREGRAAADAGPPEAPEASAG